MELDDLVEKKKEIEKQIKIEKIKSRKGKRTAEIANMNIRVSPEFNSELEEILLEREKNGINCQRVSKPMITTILVRHKLWPKLKDSLIHYLFTKNRKGQTSVFLFLLILASFCMTIGLLVMGIIAVNINNALDKDIAIGQVNLQTVNADTWGKFTTMYLNSADWWGMAVIFGTILGMFMAAYLTRNSTSKLGVILDIFMIIVMYFIAVYFSKTYASLLDSLAAAGQTFLEDYTPKTSKFVLNLPLYVSIVGIVCMVLFHSSIPRKGEETRGGNIQGL